MKRIWLLVFLLLPPAVLAQKLPQANGSYLGVMGETPRVAIALGYCQLSISTAVFISTCSGGIPANTRTIYLTPETAALRCRDDGTAPTATIGNPVAVGAQLRYSASNGVTGPGATLKCIAQTGTSTVNVWFYN